MASTYGACSSRAYRKVCSYGVLHEGVQICLTHKKSDSEIEVVTFNRELYQKFMKRCESGFARSMLSQWKSTTIDVLPALLDQAQRNAPDLRVRELQSLASKIEHLFGAIKSMDDHLNTDFYRYEVCLLSTRK